MIHKDSSERPRRRFSANHLHDLIIAREWIHLSPIKQIRARAAADNLQLKESVDINRLW